MKFYFLSFLGFMLLSSVKATNNNIRKRNVTLDEEDLYIKHFGNDPYDYVGWKALKNRYYDVEPKVKKLCAKAHQIAGYGDDVNVDWIILNRRTLLFNNEDYRSKSIDVITYATDKEEHFSDKTNYWFITEGVRKDCVFYLDLVNPLSKEFKLRKQVCRIYEDF